MTGGQRDVRVRRVYDEPGPDDGARVLVDRIWPRGMRKERAALDEWAKDVAPSDELRRWYGHDPGRYADFARRYRVELAESGRAQALARLRDRAASGRLTLLTATRNVDHSHATVLTVELSESD
ncbi:hypothetical protein N566_00880 [Streptomycetaceae bacterium MP113-05]|nr:hypothetical protein N566_00880 [Streptomycetaceae bacterium MP113-05]